MSRPPSSLVPPFCQYSQFLIDRYGEQLHRIPIDFGFGCPNRAADGSGGCAFCPEHGARARQTLRADTVEEQVLAGIEFARRRYGARHFMAYIQAFTGTFAAEDARTEVYRELLSMADFRAVSIGTRPDCLDASTMAFLGELSRELDVWVELGVQTVHDDTLARIGRGHDWEASRRAILALHDAGINVAVHVILALPGEGREEVLRTAETLASLPVDGIKIHNLHVVRGTPLAAEFAEAPFPVLNEHHYADLLIEFLRRLPPDLPIMRVQTDTPEEELVAPRWSMDKGQFLSMLISRMVFADVRQGDLSRPPAGSTLCRRGPDWAPVSGADGSVTFWSPEFREHFHPPAGARATARAQFVDACDLRGRLAAGDVRLLDVGFGLGYNTLSACNMAAESATGRLHATVLDLDRRAVLASARAMIGCDVDMFDWADALSLLYDTGNVVAARFDIRALWGDARHTVTLLRGRPVFDIVFLDPFSVQRNTELWTLDFFRAIREVMAPHGVLVTRCTAISVRAALMQAGLCVGASQGRGSIRGATVAAVHAEDIPSTLSAAHLAALRDPVRGAPYRDPPGTWDNRQILRDREQRLRS